MAPDRHVSAVIEFPSELEIVISREFDAPIGLVFDVLTKPEHVSKWGATPPDWMTECSIDLRVGGNYHSSFVTGDGAVFSFSGTYLEVEPPNRTVATWHFNCWPDAEAVETMELHEIDGVTTLTWKMAFRDKAGRDHMTGSTASKTVSTRSKTSSGRCSTRTAPEANARTCRVVDDGPRTSRAARTRTLALRLSARIDAVMLTIWSSDTLVRGKLTKRSMLAGL